MRLTHFENLIDISRVDELKNIELRGDEVWIGAGTPHAFVGMDDEVADSVPLLTLATPYIGHFQIRTRGTLGGAIAHADPAAEYAAVALALDATMEATSPRGPRQIPASEFFTGLWETSLAPDEILTAVGFPVWGGRSGFAIEEFARRHGDFAIAGLPSQWNSMTLSVWAVAASACWASVRHRCAVPSPRRPSSVCPSGSSPQKRSAGWR
jgi:aerobic carbon-monoxide dehydrogenase medium subunit